MTLHPACISLTQTLTQKQKRRPSGGALALLLEYRYGDSNPGFRTENPAS
jgi:hypothetical protein